MVDLQGTKAPRAASKGYMRKHLLSFGLGVFTFAVGVMAGPPLSFCEIRHVEVVAEEQGCYAKNLSSEFGKTVVLWSCPAATSYQSAEEEFESQIRHYSVITRSENRAIVSYFTGESEGYCVLRLDGDRHHDICARELKLVLQLEHAYFGKEQLDF